MQSSQIRAKFLEFFKKRGHAIIPSASLITTDEKGVTNPTLFNTAGMQPLIPYLLGQKHLLGTRLADVQKCLRTVDIDDIGDKTHATFFEMLGNWSLGDYFKKEAIEWSYEFLTSKEEGLGLDPNRLYVTVFEGDANAPRDDEAAEIWQNIFKSDTKNSVCDFMGKTQNGELGRIFFMPADKNWWEAGENGPCGPDSEMYYDVSGKLGGKGLTKAQFIEADDTRTVIEVWNDVFMQYEKRSGKIIGKLPKPSVDTGAGLERLTMTMQGVDNIYDTDLLKTVIELVRSSSKNFKLESARIVADHIKASVFLISDGVLPSNTDRGYVLRKLLRRAVRHADTLGMNENGDLELIASRIIDIYHEPYPEVKEKEKIILTEIQSEEKLFRETLRQGLKEFEKGVDPFTLFSSYGFPLELTLELANEKGIAVDTKDFEEKFKKHQELSRSGAEKKFKGGLEDANNPQVVKYHTATHLLHQALHDVLGDSVGQKGSNITPERLRFDFSHSSKMTDEEKKKVEDIVNEKIASSIPVNQITLPIAEAEKTGARHFFGDKYGDQVSVYYIGPTLEKAYSKEFCGGPHVKNTSELGHFRIAKEEAVAQGIRRIKAILE